MLTHEESHDFLAVIGIGDKNLCMPPRQNASQVPLPWTRKALLLPLLFTGIFVALGFISRARSNPHLAWTYAGLTVFLLCWQLMLLIKAGRGVRKFAWEFAAVRSHYVQAIVQLSIYAYWGWYWRNVYGEMPLILSQVAFIYILDALLTWSRGQTWRLGFGPWPIILSTNLFMWFRDDWFVFQFLMVAMGVLGKQFIRWERGGKSTHIFNPSAFGLTIVSLVLIFTGTTGNTWGEQIAITQGLPPHLYSEIFLCGLVVQYFFGVTLLTFSAAAMLSLLTLAYTKITGVYLFVDSNIPIAVFLGLHLLMTDPATTPRSSVGKVLFGSLYAGGVFWAYVLLRAFNAPEFYDKLVVVPILNLLVPALDRLTALGVAGRFGSWEQASGLRKMNLAYMAGWATLFLTMLCTGFVESPHVGATIAFWEKACEENRPQAVENLHRLLDDFNKRDLDDPSEAVLGSGNTGRLSRQEALGILCNQVATIYAQGRFVPADPAKAAHYFDKACEFGNEDGCANLTIEYFQGNLAGTPVDISRALSTLEQTGPASKNGRYCFIVGFAYDTGRGRTVDKVKARAFYEKGAEFGDLQACKNLARMQLGGEGGPPDHGAAATWLQKAADRQDGPSCLYLARMYHSGDGVPRDEQKAVALLKEASGLGIEPARMLLEHNQGSQ
jgi:TPR repeat protein